MVFISQFLSDAELRRQLSTYIKLLDGQEKALEQREEVVQQRAEMVARREAELEALAKQLGVQTGQQVSLIGVH
jgi:hypothetical protein